VVTGAIVTGTAATSTSITITILIGTISVIAQDRVIGPAKAVVTGGSITHHIAATLLMETEEPPTSSVAGPKVNDRVVGKASPAIDQAQVKALPAIGPVEAPAIGPVEAPVVGRAAGQALDQAVALVIALAPEQVLDPVVETPALDQAVAAELDRPIEPAAQIGSATVRFHPAQEAAAAPSVAAVEAVIAEDPPA
jgi:hypothetical protein